MTAPTLTIKPAKATKSRVEFRPNDGSPPETFELAKFPFVLGRGETCDFCVPSSRVSREHATLSLEEDRVVLKDLGSTNGTFLNGRRLQKQEKLTDGDIFALADLSFTFYDAGEKVPESRLVTQVFSLEPDETASANDLEAVDLLLSARAANEMLMCGAIRLAYQPIMDSPSCSPIGFEVGPREGFGERGLHKNIKNSECSLFDRVSQMGRWLAIEQGLALWDAESIFVSLNSREAGSTSAIVGLERLAEAGLELSRVVVQIPDSCVSDSSSFTEFVTRLRELEMSWALENCQRGEAQLVSLGEFAPKYIKLPPGLSRDIDRAEDRRRQISACIAGAKRIGAEVIATNVNQDVEMGTFLSLGIKLAQGNHFSPLQPLDSLFSSRMSG